MERNVLSKGIRARLSEAGIVLCLALAILAVYWRVKGYPFVHYDDPSYVSENPQVLGGLTLASVRWAFTSFEAANWHPLTWLSHMGDMSLFGLNPGAHHLVNVALHLANSMLCFALLRGLTGSRWRSALVAALFALHPCHVESVAWIAERKDVLSTLFWLLTTLAYLAYVRRPAPRRYALVLVFFALGMLAKPMIVTLPVTLLLLDFWPLGRLDRLHVRKLLLEKVPLFAMAGALAILTILAQHRGGAMSSLHGFPLGDRVANAIVATMRYLGQMLWPTKLAIFYPMAARDHSLGKVLAALAGLGIFSALCLLQFRRRPWLLMGWCWYLVLLAPVIGIIQVGGQSMADRYTYLSFLGPFIMAAWGLGELVDRLPRFRWPVVAAASVGVGVLITLGYRQVGYWRDTYTLFAHAHAVTRNNDMACMNMGYALVDMGKHAEAEQIFREAQRIAPKYTRAAYCLAQTLEAQGRLNEALCQYQGILAAHPNEVEAHCLMGQVLMRLGRNDEAIGEYWKALPAPPERLGEGARGRDLALATRINLGLLLVGRNQFREAAKCFVAALRLCPLGPDPRSQVANGGAAGVLLRLGHPKEAADLWSRGLAIDPKQPQLWFDLGRARLELKQRPEAVQAFRQALALDPGFSQAQRELDALL